MEKAKARCAIGVVSHPSVAKGATLGWGILGWAGFNVGHPPTRLVFWVGWRHYSLSSLEICKPA